MNGTAVRVQTQEDLFRRSAMRQRIVSVTSLRQQILNRADVGPRIASQRAALHPAPPPTFKQTGRPACRESGHRCSKQELPDEQQDMPVWTARPRHVRGQDHQHGRGGQHQHQQAEHPRSPQQTENKEDSAWQAEPRPAPCVEQVFRQAADEFPKPHASSPSTSVWREREGFEPPEPFGSTVFKTAAFDHSATSPHDVPAASSRGAFV